MARQRQLVNEGAAAGDTEFGADHVSVEGKVGGVEGGAITGWVWDAARPYDPLEVEVFAGSLQVGRGRADKFDLELAKSKLGNGMHRFEVHLDKLPAGAPPFVLRVVVAGSDVELFPSISLLTLDDAQRLVSGSDYLGRVTGIANGAICGWVLNRGNPHEQPVLALRDGDRALLTQAVSERMSAALDSGVTANVYRFELPLPMSLMDGNQHLLSVCVDQFGRDLPGSPVLFGPSDVTSVGRSLAAALDSLQRLDRRVEALQPGMDLGHFEKQITTRVLDRIDMLLNIHRDAIEREMAVMRRQLTHLTRQLPALEPDVILPVTEAPAIEDEPIPAATTFSALERASPMLTYDLSTRTIAARPSGGISWTKSDSASGLSITGSGVIELDGIVSAPVSLILSGDGSKDPFEFCSMLAAFDGRPMSGRVDIFESRAWTLIGTTTDSTVPGLSARGLAIEYLSGGGSHGALRLTSIAVFAAGHAPTQIESSPPRASVINLGSEQSTTGWHPVETNSRGGFCWMGAQSETPFRLKPSRSYRIVLPEVRPLTPEIMPKLQIHLGNVPATLKFSPLPGDKSVYSISGECSLPHEGDNNLVLRISFPQEAARSPQELGLNMDQRPLTIAVRTIGVSATD